MFSIGIVAHTARAEEAHTLFTSVGASFLSMDNGRRGCDLNHDHVHRWLASQPTDWAVILEDDAIPVTGFRAQLGQCLAHAPSPLVGLYLGRCRPPQYQSVIGAAVSAAEAVGADWVLSDRMYHGVGYAVRTDLLASLVDFRIGLPVDERISEWASSAGLRVAYCSPSLVDHADWPTVIPRHNDGQPRTSGRVAWNAGPHLEWSNKSVSV